MLFALWLPNNSFNDKFFQTPPLRDSNLRRPKFSLVCARNKWAGNMLTFHFDITIKRLGTRFKNDWFQWFRVDSFFWETITLYTLHFQI